MSTYIKVGSFEVEELDDEDLQGPITERAPVIDINEYRKSKEYRDFWSDPCWAEPPGHLG
jgi:hypothetical protein